MLAIAQKDDERRSFAAFLPYAHEVGDGLVLCKDGGLMVGYAVDAPDFAALGDASRDYLTRAVVAALGVFDEGWSFHYDLVREPLPRIAASLFPDSVTQSIEDARVLRFNEPGVSFGSTLTLAVRWTPPTSAERKASRAVASAVRFGRRAHRRKADDGGGDALRELDRRIDAFATALEQFEDLASTALSLRRLATERLASGMLHSPLISHLHQAIHGDIRPPRETAQIFGQYLDCELAFSDFYAGIRPYLSGRHVAIVAIDGFPAETEPAMLAALAAVPVEYRWSTRFVMLSPGQSSRLMQQQRRKWEQTASSYTAQFLGRQAGGHKARRAAMMVADIDEAELEEAVGDVRYGHFTSVFVLRSEDPDDLRELARTFRSALAAHGCGGRIEDANATEAFLGSFPGDIRHNIRRPLMHTLHFANLIPLTSSWRGLPRNPNPYIEGGDAPALMRTRCAGGSAFDLNIHVGDVGHTLIFGATGSGKSVLLAMIAAQFRRYARSRVVVFDKGRAMRALTLGVGGEWAEIGFDDGRGFAPLRTLAPPDGRVDEADRAWACEWIEAIARINGMQPTVAQRGIITDAVALLSEPGAARSMLDLRVAVQDADMQSVLERYCGDGQFAPLFDADDPGAFDRRFACYETDEMMQLPQGASLPLLLYLFRMVERNATAGEPTLIVLDEAWALLGHPAFAERIRDWLKTMRKKNVAVVMATQSLADARKSGLLDVLVESCPTKIFGANPEADASSRDGYLQLGLTDADAETVARIRRKREYYVTVGDQRRVVDMDLGREELAWCGVSDPATIARMDALIERHPDDWRERWAEEYDS